MATSNLIAYEPLDSFGLDKDYWISYARFYEIYWGGPTSPFGVWFGNEYQSFRKSISKELGIDESEIRDCYFLKDEDDNYYISPMQYKNQDYMIYVNNVIPLEWFTMFSEDERKTLISHWGFNAIYYHSQMSKSIERIDNVLEFLNNQRYSRKEILGKFGILLFIDNIIRGCNETYSWIKSFDPNSYIVLNYGDICNYIHLYTLDNEHSVGELIDIIEKLKKNEFEQATKLINILVLKWTEISNFASGSESKDTIQ